MSELKDRTELHVDGQPDSRAVWDRIVEYDEALEAGKSLKLHEDATIRALSEPAQDQVFGVLECLDLLCRIRRHKERGDCPLIGGSALQTATSNWKSISDQETAPSSEAPFLTIGEFEVLHEIGRGGHGVVFAATDQILRRSVALKVPRPEFLLSKAMRARFIAEARAVADLDHPNIVKVFEAGTDGPVCFIAQELCLCTSLDGWLLEQSTPVDPVLAARICLQLARGLEHAHARGILHRDLKPANVLLKPATDEAACERSRQEGRSKIATFTSGDDRFPYVPKLGDFGICKAFDDENRTLTRTGTVLGTAAYMAPEQALGKSSEVGCHSDIYGLGAMLYELLAGKPPIVGESPADTLRRIPAEDPPPLRSFRSDVPVELDAICFKCLEKASEQRYGTAGALADDLERFLCHEPVQAAPIGRIRRTVRRLRRQPATVFVGVAAVFTLLVALMGNLLILWTTPRSTVTTRPNDPPVNREASYLDGIGPVAQNYFEAVASRADVKSAVRNLDTFLKQQWPEPGRTDYRGPEWHYLWRLSHPEKVARPFPKLLELKGHKGEIYFVTFSPDGTLVASAGQDRTARVWDAATGKLRTTLIGHTDDVNWITFYDRWLLTAGDDRTVRIWDRESGKQEAVLNGLKAKLVAVAVAHVGRHDGDRMVVGDEILAGDHDGRILVWDWKTKRRVRTIEAHGNRIEAISHIREPGLWMTSSADGTAKEWNVNMWTSVRTHAIDTPILGASSNLEGSLMAFATGSTGAEVGTRTDGTGNELGGRLIVDDLYTGARWMTLVGPPSHGYSSVRFYPGRCCAVGVSRDRIVANGRPPRDVVCWDLPTQHYWDAIGTEYPGCWCADFSPDGCRMATAGNDGIVRIWDSSTLPSGTRLNRSDGRVPQTVPSIHFAPDGRSLLMLYQRDLHSPPRCRFTVWDMSGERPKEISSEAALGDFEGSAAACYSPDGRFLAVEETRGRKDHPTSRIQIRDSRSLKEIAHCGGYEGVPRKLIFSAAGDWIVATTWDEVGGHSGLSLWKRGKESPEFASRSAEQTHFLTTVLSPDGKQLATNHQQVELYDFPSMRFVRSLPFGLGREGAIQFSPQGDVLAAGGQNGIVHLWGVGEGREGAELRSDGHRIASLAFSPDGSRLAVGLVGTPRVDLWHVKTGKRLTGLALPCDMQPVCDLAFSPDQRTLAAAAREERGGVFLFPLAPVDETSKPFRP
jgi:eukaryotic-like serine/threonine-protein kinase